MILCLKETSISSSFLPGNIPFSTEITLPMPVNMSVYSLSHSSLLYLNLGRKSSRTWHVFFASRVYSKKSCPNISVMRWSMTLIHWMSSGLQKTSFNFHPQPANRRCTCHPVNHSLLKYKFKLFLIFHLFPNMSRYWKRTYNCYSYQFTNCINTNIVCKQ